MSEARRMTGMQHTPGTTATTATTATTRSAAGVGTPDMELVRRLVTEVVHRLRAAGATNADPTSQPLAAPSPAIMSAAPPAGAPAAAGGGGGGGVPESPAAGHVVNDAVVTLAVIQRLPAGTRRLIVSARAVITPSAREQAADSGLEIMRADPRAAVSRAFLIAHADCAADATVKAAVIARAIAGSRQLPAAGLGDVIRSLVLEIGGGARGVLLTGRPALAVAAANRHASLRAVTGHDGTRVQAAALECAANLLVLDPAAFSATALERLCDALAHGPDRAAPAELAGGDGQAAPCGCRNTHH